MRGHSKALRKRLAIASSSTDTLSVVARTSMRLAALSAKVTLPSPLSSLPSPSSPLLFFGSERERREVRASDGSHHNNREERGERRAGRHNHIRRPPLSYADVHAGERRENEKLVADDVYSKERNCMALSWKERERRGERADREEEREMGEEEGGGEEREDERMNKRIFAELIENGRRITPYNLQARIARLDLKISQSREEREERERRRGRGEERIFAMNLYERRGETQRSDVRGSKVSDELR